MKQNREKAAGDDRDLLVKNRLDSQTSEAVSAPTQSFMPSSFNRFSFDIVTSHCAFTFYLFLANLGVDSIFPNEGRAARKARP